MEITSQSLLFLLLFLPSTLSSPSKDAGNISALLTHTAQKKHITPCGKLCHTCTQIWISACTNTLGTLKFSTHPDPKATWDFSARIPAGKVTLMVNGKRKSTTCLRHNTKYSSLTNWAHYFEKIWHLSPSQCIEVPWNTAGLITDTDESNLFSARIMNSTENFGRDMTCVHRNFTTSTTIQISTICKTSLIEKTNFLGQCIMVFLKKQVLKKQVPQTMQY